MGGEGGFIVRATGHGTIVMACFGALDVWDLAAGETFVLDTNHMVAYDESVEYKLRRAVEGRSIQSMKSGEGWVFEFTGPGRVYGQTRSPQSLTKWLEQHAHAEQQLGDRRRRARLAAHALGARARRSGRHLLLGLRARPRRHRARRP